MCPSNDIPTVFKVGPIIYWIAFYYLGVWVSQKNRNYSIHWPLFIALVGFVAQILESFYLMDKGQVGIGIKVSAWIYAFAAILVLFSIKAENVFGAIQRKIYFFLKKVGIYSFGIYLLHDYIIIAVNKSLQINCWGISWLIIVVLSVLIILVIDKIIPEKLSRPLGIK